jgi:hypothetical protein
LETAQWAMYGGLKIRGRTDDFISAGTITKNDMQLGS